MADETPEEKPDFETRFKSIVEHEKPKTHHECECRDCDPLTAMRERGEAFAMSKSLLFDSGIKWDEQDVPSVREVITLADWLLYGPDTGDN